MDTGRFRDCQNIWEAPKIGRWRRVAQTVSPEEELGFPTCRGYTWVFALWLVPQGAVFEFSFHAIHSIELKFTIDKRPDLGYHFVCYLEQTSRNALPLLPLSPLFPSACALLNSLAALFRTPILCFQ